MIDSSPPLPLSSTCLVWPHCWPSGSLLSTARPGLMPSARLSSSRRLASCLSLPQAHFPPAPSCPAVSCSGHPHEATVLHAKAPRQCEGERVEQQAAWSVAAEGRVAPCHGVQGRRVALLAVSPAVLVCPPHPSTLG